jgi:DNA-directed RNA polymerase specialized sigma24 family protein
LPTFAAIYFQLGMSNSIFSWFSRENPCRFFETNEQLFDALAREESAAIVCLQTKTVGSVRKIVQNFGLAPDLTDDILNKSTVIFLQKIADGSYQFHGNAPSTYLIEIARNVAHMATRKRKGTIIGLENQPDLADIDAENTARNLENTDLVRHFLAEIGEPCATVIRLQHIDGVPDEVAVNQRLTRYSTPDSLKMKRLECMKKLILIAQKWKISNNI